MHQQGYNIIILKESSVIPLGVAILAVISEATNPLITVFLNLMKSFLHFTMFGFTVLGGNLFLCQVIIAGVQEKYEVECGIDIDTTPVWDPSDTDYFEKNRGKRKLLTMGLECLFNDKTVPCMVRWSPSGSITSVILRDTLATMDHNGLLNCSSDRKPFLLLDGHQSCFELPFLQYVINPDHPWIFCEHIGLCPTSSTTYIARSIKA